MKRHIAVSIDEEIHNKAKDRGFNISLELERALTDKLNKNQVEIPKPLKCEYCGKEGRKETADDVSPIINIKDPIEHPNLLVWLFPDEKWICNSCLRSKVSQVPVAQK